MKFCPECGGRLSDIKNFCPECGKQISALNVQSPRPFHPDPKTAHIYGISGSTRYLLKGIRPIKGKKSLTLDELHHLHDHCDEILTETKTTIRQHYDEIIVNLSNEESRIRQQMDERIARREQEVDRNIIDLKNSSFQADGFSPKCGADSITGLLLL